MRLSKEMRKKIKVKGYRLTPCGINPLKRRSRPIKILQFYSVEGKKLKTPKIVNYSVSLAHNLYYHSGHGLNAFKVLYRRK